MPAQPADGPPTSGIWWEGAPAGGRKFTDVGDVKLETGEALPGVRVAYETWGQLNADASNAVLILHALTGDSHVIGPAGEGHPTAGWWPGMVGPGAPIDTRRYFVVAPNVLGGCQGTTGPSTSSGATPPAPWGSRFPRITVRDQIAVEVRLADTLGIERWAAVLGGSMGGMRAVEWAVTWPERVDRLMLLATCAAASAEQIGLSAAQIQAIRADPAFRGGDYYDVPPDRGPTVGLGIARRIAHISYRSEPELQTRFGRAPQKAENPYGDGRFAVESYLDHQADKLVRRFDANSYVRLSEAMNTHDVGRDRGGIESALARVSARTVVAGVDSDRLYPLWQQEELARYIPGAGPVAVVSSPCGHDGFLVETAAVGALVADLLSE
ncbi:homoserine O-acetyltransferase MetX [Phytoactinopolyspora limicola]|uniref:homoserine O-acetyltransferase MetX n=1 Tax=Phytoactinopolyspora limicola TaxID=2715536 RepID=UPI00140D79DD|nr:homoserine O-acetyltransferase [Phytoactinopolyspora limicola]